MYGYEVYKPKIINERIYKYLEELINDFSLETLQSIFSDFKFKNLNHDILDNRLFSFENDRFVEIKEFLKVNLIDDNVLKCYAVRVNDVLSDRSSKKNQFELAKKILRNDIGLDAGIFVFYDDNKNFRLSLVYKVYLPSKTNFSHFKRYTYFVENKKPYRTFLKSISEGDFSTLPSIINSFSVIPLTKEFFIEIQNWYAWALKLSHTGEVYFPGGNIEENLIRLITRLIFVWFLKQKGLIPEKIFDENELFNIVKNFKTGDSYYNVILQNLFFATLNTYAKDRGFAKDGDFIYQRTDFGVKTLFRYKDKILITEEDFIKIFDEVPFVNGGLFECLDDDSYYIDGFSRNENKRAKLPDFLFFSNEKKEDLSFFYGEKKEVNVRGIINILKDYNFTADESSPIDIEVSLDPELLGHIFENLLASYNPETRTTARKATGSYYTPKEIVDFMVEESLFQYFKTKTSIDDKKLRNIISYQENELDLKLNENERQDLIRAIDSLKVIDLAVGSGAFPMGILQKLVYILNKIDPENKYWYELQYNKAINELEQVLKISDQEEKISLLRELNENFDDSFNYPDYSRKLYIIENSIYGVDIQNIAIQIAKLRFFLSLIIDQKVDRSKENFGIKALPHLETKFITANSLVALEKPQLLLSTEKLKNLKKELKNIYKKFFRIKTRKEKLRLKEKTQNIKNEIKEELKKNSFPDITIQKIVDFDIFSQLKGNDFFDSEWMFGVDDGFDIVIGNPPYIRQEKIKEFKPILKDQGYKVFDSTADIYVYFYERGYKLLKEEGVLCYISSNKWMRAKYGKNLRSFLKKNTFLITLVDFWGYRVFEQTVDTCIVLFKKLKSQELLEGWKFSYCIVPSDCSEIIEYIRSNYRFMEQNKLSDDAWTLADDKELVLKEKIERVGKPLKEWDVKIYRGVLTGFNEAFIIDTQTRNRILANCRTEDERKRTEEIIKPVLRGRDIHKWRYKWEGFWIIKIEAGWTNKHCKKENPEEFFKNIFSSLYNYFLQFKDYKGKGKGLLNRDDQGDYWWELRHCDYYSEFEKEKIVWQRVTKNFSFCFVPKGLYTLDSIAFMTGENLRFILGILNSKVIDFYVKTYVHQLSDTGFLLSNQYVERIPIPIITLENEEIAKRIEILVNKIIDITSCKDYESDLNKQSEVKTLENEINALVYKLYNLTTEEIQIIEKNYN